MLVDSHLQTAHFLLGSILETEIPIGKLIVRYFWDHILAGRLICVQM
uniref:Uncharacterized protein n=1 Tax=Anguilla anguilla TaxID=7936 RepID=A0A0E9XZV5_ANGAN